MTATALGWSHEGKGEEEKEPSNRQKTGTGTTVLYFTEPHQDDQACSDSVVSKDRRASWQQKLNL